jgi:type IV pilus assembly protein PilQ
MAESGMDFSITRGSDLNLGINIRNMSAVSKSIFTATVAPTGGNLAVGISAGLSMFEAEQLGEVLARPQINVRSGSSSVFQVGADFSVLEKDFSGNTVQKFYPTGTILTIKPKIWKYGDREFIDVSYKIEKSTFESTPTTTIINKTTASGSLTLLNGEEGYVGGMYSNEETYVRQGVPVLKDLPWWVLGLRYIFGYESKKVIKRELLVLLKAEILPSVEERAARPPTKNLTKDIKQEMEKDFNKRKTEK